MVQSNVVRSRLIILINEEINEANGLDKIVAKKKNKKKKKVAEKKIVAGKNKIVAGKKKITKRIGW